MKKDRAQTPPDPNAVPKDKLYNPDYDHSKLKFQITINVFENCQTMDAIGVNGHDPTQHEVVGALEIMKAISVFRQAGVNADAYRQWEKKQKLIMDEIELLSCPGDTLQEYMKVKNWDCAKVAIGMDMDLKDVNALLKGGMPIDDVIAAKLEKYTKIDAQFWLNRENNYRTKLQQIINNQ